MKKSIKKIEKNIKIAEIQNEFLEINKFNA